MTGWSVRDWICRLDGLDARDQRCVNFWSACLTVCAQVFSPSEHTIADLLGIFPPTLSELCQLGISRLPDIIRAPIETTTLTFEPMLFHAGVLAIFASVIAPFAGFFASGFKRAFRVKDFAAIIPGHGGMTDRMDCQVNVNQLDQWQLFFVTDSHGYVLLSLLLCIHSTNWDRRCKYFGSHTATRSAKPAGNFWQAWKLSDRRTSITR